MANKGHTEPDLFGGGYTHYDEKGNKIGRSEPNFFGGGYTTYDSKGNKIGSSDPQLFGSGYTNSDSSGGCYIATCVYGSYDCPQVWTLRRFRDDTLKQSVPGRAFVRIYYAISPTLVRRFGQTTLFRRFWRARLDRMVKRLNAKGVADTKYEDQ